MTQAKRHSALPQTLPVSAGHGLDLLGVQGESSPHCPSLHHWLCWARELTWVGEPRLLSSRNSSKVTISLLGEAERGRPPVWAGAAPLFWTHSWGTGPFLSEGYSWRLRTARPGVLGSLLGIRSELLKLSQRLCRRSEEPGRATQGARRSYSLPYSLQLT